MKPRALPMLLAGVFACGSRTVADTAPTSDTLAPEPDSETETGLETEPETETGAETETETEFETDTETGTETESERETGADTGMDTGSAPVCVGLGGVATGSGPTPASAYDAYVHERASVAVAHDGTYAIGFAKAGAPPFAAYLTLFTAGVPIGVDIEVSDPVLDFVDNPPAVAAGDGEVVVAWTDRGTTFAVWVRRFTTAGVPMGSAVRVSPPDHFVAYAPAVALDPAGDAVVAWTDSGGWQVYAQAVDPSGALRFAAPVLASSPGHSVDRQPAVTADDAGFAVAWTATYGVLTAAFVQRFDPAGASMFTLNPTPASHSVLNAPAISSSSDGAFVVAWNDEWTFDVFAQAYDAAGVHIGGAVRANQTGAVYFYSDGFSDTPPPQSVSMACDGSFVVGWTTDRAWFRPYDAAARPMSDETGGTYRTELPASVAVAPSGGSFVHVWTDDAQSVQHEWYAP